MAWFDIGAGLAEMGKTVSQTLSVAMLEQLKSSNEEARMRLADELAGKRQDKQNEFQRGERVESQTYQSGEKQKDRDFQGSENDKSRAVQREGHGVTLASARMQIEARREEAEKDRQDRREGREAEFSFRRGEREADQGFRSAEAEKERNSRSADRDKTIEAQFKAHTSLQVNEDGTAVTFNPVTKELTPVLDANGKPVKFRDPQAARAQAEALSTSKDQMNQVIRLYENDLRQAQAELKIAKETAARSPEGIAAGGTDNLPSVVAARKRIEEVEAKYRPQISEYTQRTNALIQHLLKQSGITAPKPAGTGGPSLSDFDGKPRPAPNSPPGLINQVP